MKKEDMRRILEKAESLSALLRKARGAALAARNQRRAGGRGACRVPGAPPPPPQGGRSLVALFQEGGNPPLRMLGRKSRAGVSAALMLCVRKSVSIPDFWA